MNWWQMASSLFIFGLGWVIGYGRGVRYALAKIAQTQQRLGDFE